MRSVFLSFAMLPIVFTVTTPSTAQVASTAGQSEALDEIIVTAQRRSESLEKTPVAVSVLSADALAKQVIVSESDLRTAVPGLTVRPTNGSNDLVYSIRGQTVDAFSASNPAVLPYVNEVQISGGGGTSAFYDLQSVQVLKGPQGTLFGKNTTGGAVVFTTQKPTEQLEGYLTVRGGNYDERQVEGAVNIPIVNDTVFARVSGFAEKRDGFQYNTISETKVGDVDRFGLRGSLTVKFTDSIKNDLVIDFAHSGGSSTSLVLSYVAPQFSNNAFIPANLLYTPFLDTILHSPGAFAAYTAANPKFPAGGIFSALAIQNARGPFIISINSPLTHLANNLITSDILTVHLAEDLEFKNIFGYTHISTRDGDDVDGSAFPIDGTALGLNHIDVQYSEEPQFIGKAFDSNLSYVAGGYFSDEKLTQLDASNFADLSPLAPATVQLNNTLKRDKTYAGYGQGTYDLSSATGLPGLSVSAGARYSSEKISSEQLPGSSYYFNPPVAPYSPVLSNTFNKVSWEFGVQEQIDPNLLVYVVTRRSFRSGGFNNLTPPLPAEGNNGGAAFGAETATDVELGVKFQGTVGSMPARLNVAAYNNSIKGIQRTIFTEILGSVGTLTVNVPKTRVSGLELEGQINPASWLKVGASVNFTDAVFTDNLVTIPGTPPLTSVAFGPAPDSPRWSGSVFSEVVVPVSDRLDFSIRGDFYDQTSSYFSSTNNTLTRGSEISGYGITNFRIGLGSNRAGWSVAAVVKNAFNRVYYVGGLATLNVWGSNAVIPGDPRTFVGEASYKF